MLCRNHWTGYIHSKKALQDSVSLYLGVALRMSCFYSPLSIAFPVVARAWLSFLARWMLRVENVLTACSHDLLLELDLNCSGTTGRVDMHERTPAGYTQLPRGNGG